MLHVLYVTSSWRNNPGIHPKIYYAFFLIDSLKGLLSLNEHLFDFSKKWSEVNSLSRVWLFATSWTVAYRLLCPWDSPGNSTGVDCHSLLQGIFPTWGSNPGLPNCRQTLYRLSHQESPFSKKDPVNSNVSPLFSPCSDIQVFLILRRDIVLYYTGNSWCFNTNYRGRMSQYVMLNPLFVFWWNFITYIVSYQDVQNFKCLHYPLFLILRFKFGARVVGGTEILHMVHRCWQHDKGSCKSY